MINRIKRVKNLGLFRNYAPVAKLKDFNQFNLIYGWNGCGKTTFSRLFDSLESGSHIDYPTLEYEIETTNRFVQGIPFDRKVRIFNQDYIDANLQIRQGKTKSITLVLGSASKELLEAIDGDERELIQKNSELKIEKEEQAKKVKLKDKGFTDIARSIYAAITGGATRTYRKDNAETDFRNLTEKAILSEEELNKSLITVKQSEKPLIDPPSLPELDLGDERISLDVAIADILLRTNNLLPKRVDAMVINRLAANSDISSWVERGLALHHIHNSKHCEFCNQYIPENRLLELANHFNDADKQLKEEADNISDKVEKLKEIVTLANATPDNARLYEEFSRDYGQARVTVSSTSDGLIEDLDKIQSLLEEKKLKTTEALTCDTFIDPTNFNKSFQTLNGFLTNHNRMTNDFTAEKAKAIDKIKKHYLSEIFDETKKLEEQIIEHENKINLLLDGDNTDPTNLGINGLKTRILENRAKISSTHKACSDINDSLKTFLGRNELVFEPHKKNVRSENGDTLEVDDGYVIKRSGKVVTHLSEGEKTAIAFVYFTIHLNDPSFDRTKDIVVIDDPISSLDSNSIFQAFSFLKNAVKDVHQVFILTHNFDFLRLLLNWLNYNANRKFSSLYMIKNGEDAIGRYAYLDALDKDLQLYESEYHFLFKMLQNFQTDGTIASVYHIPNISRKVLESFLMFRVPNSDSPYQKMESLKASFDENKMTAILKFTNDQSHITGKGFDPSLVPETQKTVKYILEFIEATFPEHYKILANTA